MEFLLHILSGAGVGFLIGLTGVGGGSLMTPLLLLFGYSAPIAVGTDLFYAAITKAGGARSHHKQGHVKWKIVAALACGSVPTSIAVHVYRLNLTEQNPASYEFLLTKSLGIMLLITAIMLFLRNKLRDKAIQGRPKQFMAVIHRNQTLATFFMGLILGVCVTLSSVGAGAFCAAVLLVIYSKTSTVNIIGTDIAHAVPLTFIAGLGYFASGYVDLVLLLSLIIGSLPAIAAGSRLSSRVPEQVLQKLLASVLLALGGFYLLN